MKGVLAPVPEIIQEHHHQQQQQPIPPDASSILTALKECRTSRNILRARSIHAQATLTGFDSNIYIATTLISLYTKCGCLVDAHRVFHSLTHRNEASWNALILGYALNAQPQLALDLFAQLLLGDSSSSSTPRPNARTFVAALKSCSSIAENNRNKLVVNSDALEKTMAIHALAANHTFDQDIFVVNTLIDTYAKCGSMTDSRRVFDRSKQTNLVSKMLAESRQPDALSFVAVLKACINLAAKEEDDAVIRLLKLKSLEKGMALHAEAMKTNSHNQILVANTLVDLYCKCGSLMDAEAAFGKILRSKKTDLVLWNTLLIGYAENGEAEKALNLLYWMMKTTEDQDRDHHQPRVNSRSFVAALKACASLAELSLTKSVHRIICRLGVEENEIVATCLLDSYCRCGSMVDAQLVFDSLANRDEVVSTGLIAGYSRQGNSQRVFELFHRIHDEGLRINEVTFVCVLTACSHSGLVDKGRKFFHAMASKYGVVPGVDHYLCMVDLLKRADQPEEAAEMQLKLKELLLTT